MSLCWGGGGSVHRSCRLASLARSHYMPAATFLAGQSKTCPDIAQWPLEGKNHPWREGPPHWTTATIVHLATICLPLWDNSRVD